MNKKIKTPEVEQLFKGMLCLKSVEECYEFFEDICTINELLSLSQRFEVARMLREKKDIPLRLRRRQVLLLQRSAVSIVH